MGYNVKSVNALNKIMEKIVMLVHYENDWGSTAKVNINFSKRRCGKFLGSEMMQWRKIYVTYGIGKIAGTCNKRCGSKKVLISGLKILISTILQLISRNSNFKKTMILSVVFYIKNMII